MKKENFHKMLQDSFTLKNQVLTLILKPNFLALTRNEKARERSCIVVCPGVGMNSRRYRRGAV